MKIPIKADHKRSQWVTGCPSGKRGFFERDGAKKAAKQAAKYGITGLRPYLCDECENWHMGHKPEAVMRGQRSSREVYGR